MEIKKEKEKEKEKGKVHKAQMLKIRKRLRISPEASGECVRPKKRHQEQKRDADRRRMGNKTHRFRGDMQLKPLGTQKEYLRRICFSISFSSVLKGETTVFIIVEAFIS
jgi:hypothetical protein